MVTKELHNAVLEELRQPRKQLEEAKAS